MSALADVVAFLDGELRTTDVPDYDAARNGLQLANRGTVTKVAAAVDFSLNTVTAAISAGADLLIVHHGMFWRGVEPIVGIAYDRMRTAIEGGLAVYSSHLPLDLHPTLGNNALLARELGLVSDGTFGAFRDVAIGVTGPGGLETSALFERLLGFSSTFKTAAVATPFPPGRRTKRWAIVTGAGASTDTLAEARSRGVDTMIVGEGPHHSAVDAMESGLVVLYGGHYATETLGVRALTTHVAAHFRLETVFVDVPTGL